MVKHSYDGSVAASILVREGREPRIGCIAHEERQKCEARSLRQLLESHIVLEIVRSLLCAFLACIVERCL